MDVLLHAVRIIPGNSQDRPAADDDRQEHLLRLFINGYSMCLFPQKLVAEFVKLTGFLIKDGNPTNAPYKQEM